ncbi:MAG TPA: NAD(P)H-dependent glycerol-3-phosphate dehydrogenase [Thermoanaerobaculia bacterium]|nr:NAD(P)H-dependent glycerol-3-phosphate dehydrogenase [Thermoanaerobaculia bacterium]
MTQRPVGVLGAGSWGTALAVHAARSGHRVLLWSRSLAQVEELQRGRNARYLPSLLLPAGITATSKLEEVASADPLILAVPSHAFRGVLADLFAASDRAHTATVVSAAKGIEEQTLLRMSEVSSEESSRAGVPSSFAVLSGPSFAEELIAGTPTAVVVASADGEVASRLQRELSAANLRLYTSSDVVGVELGGATKNVVAIAAGTVAGLGYGHNTMAALLTRGLHEIARLGVAFGGDPRTFSGLAGMGDLVLTCTGAMSRNRRTGVELAKGRSVGEIATELGSTAEGVRNAASIAALAHRRGVEMPITEQMVAVMHHGKAPRIAVDELMGRGLKPEAEW